MNNKVRSALVLVAMLSWTLEAQAQKVTGIGGGDCGQWISQPSPIQKAWLLGYLSGLNASWDDLPEDPLSALSSADQAFVAPVSSAAGAGPAGLRRPFLRLGPTGAGRLNDEQGGLSGLYSFLSWRLQCFPAPRSIWRIVSRQRRSQ